MTVLETSGGVRTAESASPAPDWDLVPFEVGCARCGHDLRGGVEPCCPGCGLEFDWADAVPIERLTCLHCDYHLCGLPETRCPECGEPFTWEQVLAGYHRRKHLLFEYRWRDRPVRSLAATWWRALRPGKLWRQFDIHDPPRVKPLLAMVCLFLLAFSVSLVVSIGLTEFFTRAIWGARWNGVVSLHALALVNEIIDAWRAPQVKVWVAIVTVWASACFGALMVFRWSMKRYRVRPAQVVRVWAHAVPLMVFLVPPAIGTVLIAWALAGLYDIQLPSWKGEAQYAILLLLIVHVTWSLACGYRHYLGMPRSLAVAVASQVMAFLGALAAFSLAVPERAAYFLVGMLRLLYRNF
ncbi:MAG: hypothetical protein GY842_25355 [bacterium]|nr:hypothetical protein [bacterium]